jgi:ribonucleotide reductase beta subunit family protein with ferritin-like domain
MASAAKEPLLAEEQRLALYPLHHPDIWAAYKRQLASIWTVEEIDMSKDYVDWETKLNDKEREFLTAILAFFAGSDSVVALNITDKFCKEVHVLEAQATYMFQAMMETIHSEMYSIMIDTYIKDPEHKLRVLQNIESLPTVHGKIAWAQRWADSDAPFANRLVAFAIVEGIFFSSAFCAIYWIKQRGLLPGLTKSNEFIARDEGMHTDFACLLYSKLVNKLPPATLESMIREAVAVEKEFITEAIPCSMIGMNVALMSQYIEYVADRLAAQLGAPAKIFGASNPFQFMEFIGMESRSNMFEERGSLYQKAAVLNTGRTLDYSDDF